MMEERSDSSAEEIRDTEGSEREASQVLEAMTLQPEAVVEERGNIEEAEAVETVFVALVDNAVEPLDPSRIKAVVEDEEEYRIKVKMPRIDADEDGVWARIGSLASDEHGAYFMPEIEDEVLAASDQEASLPTDFEPVEDTGDDEGLRVSGEEIKPIDDEGDDAEEDS